jgi:hypothetical protein
LHSSALSLEHATLSCSFTGVKQAVMLVLAVLAVIGAGVGIVGAIDPLPSTTGTLTGSAAIARGTVYLFPPQLYAPLSTPLPQTVNELQARSELRIAVDVKGNFAAQVAPGSYAVVAVNYGNPDVSCNGGVVKVRAGTITRVEFRCLTFSVIQETG